MAKKIKLSNKIVNSKHFSVEGILNCDNLTEESIFVEIEDFGSVDLCEYIKQFSDSNVKITISNRITEDVE